MPFQHYYFDRITTKEQEKAIAEIDRVMRAVFDLEHRANPAEVKELYAMLKPGEPTELEYVTIEETA